ncbi:MAG: YdjY domain-containing protein [Syntrophaceae bacterium]
MKNCQIKEEHCDIHRSTGLSRREFLVSTLIASGAVIVGTKGLLEAAPARPSVKTWPKDWPTKAKPLVADMKNRAVKMYTEVSLRHLTETTTHWGIGCRTGKYADKFILISPAEPLDFHDALIGIGAKPGNNLALDSYGKYITGDRLNVTASWPGLKKPFDISDIFYDSTGKGYQILFGGNRAASEKMKTGCLTCLESCPISITSNAVYPHLRGITRNIAPNSHFRGKPEALPNTEVAPVVVFYRISSGL